MKFKYNRPRGIGGVDVLKIFLFLALAAHLVYHSETILAILVGSHLGNIPMKFESHWPKGSGGVSFYGNYPRFSIFSSGGHFVQLKIENSE